MPQNLRRRLRYWLKNERQRQEMLDLSPEVEEQDQDLQDLNQSIFSG